METLFCINVTLSFQNWYFYRNPGGDVYNILKQTHYTHAVTQNIDQSPQVI